LIREWSETAESLAWIRDFCKVAAEFPDEIQRFVSALQSGQGEAAATIAALPPARRPHTAAQPPSTTQALLNMVRTLKA
jgi:hypothetical protein